MVFSSINDLLIAVVLVGEQIRHLDVLVSSAGLLYRSSCQALLVNRARNQVVESIRQTLN